MTDKEKAIVMAYTGICMLTGDKFQTFHKYVEDIMGRPIMTHEMGLLEDTIKEKTKADFLALCADENSSENPNKWIPVSERLPEEYGEYLITWTTSQSKRPFIGISEGEETLEYDHEHNRFKFKWLLDDYIKVYPNVEVIAWMPLPEPYEPQERSDKE